MHPIMYSSVLGMMEETTAAVVKTGYNYYVDTGQGLTNYS